MKTLQNIKIDGHTSAKKIAIAGSLDGARYHVWIDTETLAPVDGRMYKNQSGKTRHLDQSKGIGKEILPQLLAAAADQIAAFRERMRNENERQQEEYRQTVRDNKIRDAAHDLLAAAEGIAALIAKHGIGDDDHESEPAVAALLAAIAKTR